MTKRTVFVVDDETQICVLLTRILQRDGYAVRAFPSGREALDALASERPDLILSDLMMPGMSGLELLRTAKERLPSVATVLTTGYASIDNVVDAMRSGVDDVVTKPFSVAEIRAVVGRVLPRSREDVPSFQPAAHGPPGPDTTELEHEARVMNAALARRFREMSLVEAIHAVLVDEPSSAELLPRCSSTVLSAVAANRAAIFEPTGPDDTTFRVRTATLLHDPWGVQRDVVSPPLALVLASGGSAAILRDALGYSAQLFEEGPLAAAPLTPRDPQAETRGLLVAGRPPAGRDFNSEDLRVLAVAGAALGDVFRAVRTAERAEEAYLDSLTAVVAATETRSKWFTRHSERVRSLSIELGKKVGLSAGELDVLDIAARLLDLGRVETPDDLLAKPGHPTPDEWTTLRQHSAAGGELVRPLGRLRHVKPVIRHHHENWDGTGYPDGLAGDEIPLLAAIVRIADAYAALTSPRAWRPALDRTDAVRQIVELSGRQFHPQFVAAFAEIQFTSADAGQPVA